VTTWRNLRVCPPSHPRDGYLWLLALFGAAFLYVFVWR